MLFRSLEPELEDVLRVLGAKRWDVLVKVGLPRSMPYFYGSLKIAITLAFVGTVLAEMTAGGRLGHRLPDAERGQPAAHAAGFCRPGDDRRDGDGDVRVVQLGRAAHHGLGAPRDAGRMRSCESAYCATRSSDAGARRTARTDPLLIAGSGRSLRLLSQLLSRLRARW